jgi:hypothetical protein
VRFGAFSGQPATPSLLDFIGERRHGLVGDFSSFTACQRSVGFVEHREDLKPSAFALFNG